MAEVSWDIQKMNEFQLITQCECNMGSEAATINFKWNIPYGKLDTDW